MLWWLVVKLTQTKVSWEEGKSIEKMSPWDWPTGNSVGAFS